MDQWELHWNIPSHWLCKVVSLQVSTHLSASYTLRCCRKGGGFDQDCLSRHLRDNLFYIWRSIYILFFVVLPLFLPWGWVFRCNLHYSTQVVDSSIFNNVSHSGLQLWLHTWWSGPLLCMACTSPFFQLKWYIIVSQNTHIWHVDSTSDKDKPLLFT